MKTDQSQNRVGNAFLVFSLLFGIGIASSMTAQAQNPDDRYTQDRNRSDNGDQNRRGRDWDRYGNYGGSSVKASKKDITPKVMLVAIDIVRIAMETVTATITVTRIASAATKMVTATSEVRSSYVKPL